MKTVWMQLLKKIRVFLKIPPYYFIKMNILDKTYINRRRFKKWLKQGLRISKNMPPLNKIQLLKDGRVLIETEHNSIFEYDFHRDPLNSGELLDIQWGGV